MIDLLYFAWVKERMGKSAEQIILPNQVQTVGQLAAYLQQRDPAGQAAFAHATLVRAAVNQSFATPQTTIHDGDEIAFFPPVTGG